MQNLTDQVCELCGEDIPFARLRALPMVRTCIPCQMKIESGVREGPVFGDTEPKEEVAPVEMDGGLVRKGNWSTNLMALSSVSGEIQSLVNGGKEREASTLVRQMPLEAQAAIVALDRDPEQMLSLTAVSKDGKANYSRQVVSLLPTETIAGMVAVRPDEKVYNTALVKAMSPQTFRRAVEETLDPIDDQRLRGKVSWEWMEAVASIEDPGRAAELLRACDPEPLEDALINRMKERDINKMAGGVSVFRFFSGDAAGAIQPSHFVWGGHFGRVLDSLFDSAPDLIRLVIRRAWERSAGDDDDVSAAKEESKADPKTEIESDKPVDEDEDISLWKRTE